MSDSTPPTALGGRPSFSFRLRSLLVVLTFVCVGLGIWGDQIARERAERRRAALEWLERRRGEFQSGALRLAGDGVSDSDLAHLRALPDMYVLDLACPNVTVAGLAHLRRLTNLRTVWAYESRVNDTSAREFEDALPGWAVLK